MGWVSAIAQFITAVVLALNFWQSYRNGKGIKEVHLATNSMKDALVISTDKEAYARGVKAGEVSSMNINHRIEAAGDAKYAEGVKHGEEYVKRSE